MKKRHYSSFLSKGLKKSIERTFSKQGWTKEEIEEEIKVQGERVKNSEIKSLYKKLSES